LAEDPDPLADAGVPIEQERNRGLDGREECRLGVRDGGWNRFECRRVGRERARVRLEGEHPPAEPLWVDVLADRIDLADRGVAVRERKREVAVHRLERRVRRQVVRGFPAVHQPLGAGADRGAGRLDADLLRSRRRIGDPFDVDRPRGGEPEPTRRHRESTRGRSAPSASVGSAGRSRNVRSGRIPVSGAFRV